MLTLIYSRRNRPGMGHTKETRDPESTIGIILDLYLKGSETQKGEVITKQNQGGYSSVVVETTIKVPQESYSYRLIVSGESNEMQPVMDAIELWEERQKLIEKEIQETLEQD